MQHHATARAIPSRSFDEAKLRQHRWRFFQIVFVFTYVGIVFDVITTAIGSQVAGSAAAYEQNPIGGVLIGRFGWLGILAALTCLMLVTYSSLRLAHSRVSPAWIKLFNCLLVIIGAIRWLAVVTAVMYIAHPIA